jgi:parallel beta-helix repeat protein
MKISVRLNHQVLLPLCGLLFFIGTITAEAAIFYVAQNGNDSNSCAVSQNIASPKLTFASAVPCLNPGDTLYIRAGTYNQQLDLQGPNKTGTLGNYITIAGYPGEKPTIQYTEGTNSYGPIKARGDLGWLIFDNLIIDGALSGNGTGWAIRDGNHDFILRNLEIKNFHQVGILVGGNNIQILNSKIHHQVSECGCSGERWYGIYFHHGTNGVLEGNEIYNNPGGGIHAYPGTITNLVIRGNSIHDNGYLDSSPVGGMVVAEDGVQSVTGVQVYNNLVYRNGVGQSIVNGSNGIRVSTGADGTKVWNNTVYRNNGSGVNIQKGTVAPTNTVVQNNIVFANTAAQIVDAGVGSTINHNLTNDPNFVNAAAFDFKLQPSSPAIDAGTPLSQITTDFRKAARPQGVTHDIGAYEVGTSVAPAPPRNLSVR